MMGVFEQIEKQFEGLGVVLEQEMTEAAYDEFCQLDNLPSAEFHRGRMEACYCIAWEMFSEDAARAMREQAKDDARLRVIVEKQQQEEATEHGSDTKKAEVR